MVIAHFKLRKKTRYFHSLRTQSIERVAGQMGDAANFWAQQMFVDEAFDLQS